MNKPNIVRKEDIKGLLTDDQLVVQIPECCREGHPDCPHVTNKPKEVKRKNIGM